MEFHELSSFGVFGGRAKREALWRASLLAASTRERKSSSDEKISMGSTASDDWEGDDGDC